MDFDDLDEAINQRIAEEGKLDGVAALLAVGSRDVKQYVPTSYMEPMPRTMPKLLTLKDIAPRPGDDAKRNFCIRAFLLYGEGEVSSQFATLLAGAPESVDIVVYEWPGHGFRAVEADCKTMEELTADCYDALTPAMKEMGVGGTYEGAPFVLIGSSLGASLAVSVAAKIRWEMGLEPASVIVLDRAAPQFPLLSKTGVEEMEKDAETFYTEFMPRMTAPLPPAPMKSLLNDWKLTSQTKEVGSHMFTCDLAVIKAKGNEQLDALVSQSKFKPTTLSLGNGDSLTVPVTASTSVGDLKKAISKVTKVAASSITLEGAKGSEKVSLVDSARVESNLSVKGLNTLRAAPHDWEHGVAVIGCGYNGIKAAMEYLREGRTNITLFDRNNQVGGYCWITAANKDSKLQTEFAAFHMWFGPEYHAAKQCGGEYVWPQGWNCWAKKPEVLEHFHYCAKEWGVLEHCRFETNVSKLDVIGKPDAADRYYELTVDSVKPDGPASYKLKASVIYSFPGSMTKCRKVTFPGEEEFGGRMGYGMCDDFEYGDDMKGKDCVILGNGAFAVENVRTCVEHATRKVYLVTRRKNLASPRMACWFVHQGPAPTPGGMVISTMEPMYNLCGMGDPWKYWSVHASADRQKVTIMQASRFGIGDVTFLCVAYGKLEYVMGEADRFSHRCVHLNNGKSISNVDFIIKSLGLLGDFGVEKLHGMDQLVGCFCGGDWRRPLLTDPLGMNAANFTTFSLGNGCHSTMKMVKFLHDFPDEFYKLQKAGLFASLPISKSRPDLDRPCYVVDVKFVMSTSIMINFFCPMIQQLTIMDDLYMNALFHKVHPFEKYQAEAIEDWNKYQKMFKEQGCDHEYIEYPYTREVMQGFIDKFNHQLGMNASLDGPDDATIKKSIDMALQQEKSVYEQLFQRGVSIALHGMPETLEGDAFEVISNLQRHDVRARLTASSEKSAQDYDPEQIQAWTEWTSAGKCQFFEVDALHHGLKDHAETVKKVYELCVQKQAPPPN
mmetsp:Transcript_16784/g.36085  ORF Transcript_16784/g.36085 Transcript_16784/m.36085 type:complete len:1004 (-) Transcript_16784:292-3303(-)|eukprot:CAMPEP_0206444406 /NCGR_PEP_ID=MMETSP0324_2-20121206/14892_1 /ASSEMBLY_ACC=CAM_ASM_000836 /TAXON_ID=2866 /ORGANISM="Crypthecodinium cohnii, Strain Seligo" /LENGTH=1003 /DNA_ID=CAMNT_0053912421 /DNA_START=88 /DNA_END=3099 /DNA_ORIENTATION=+